MCSNDFIEFVVPNETPYTLWQEHINRYTFSMHFASNKVVLDVACGAGYGTGLLSKIATLVIGVDLSRKALTYAKEHYGNTPNVEFILSDAHSLPFRDEVFNIVVSFETIEHLIRYGKFLHEVERILSVGGQIIISTPNKKLSSQNKEHPQNPFHTKEFDVGEISQLLNTFFTFQLYGQCYYTMKDWLLQILSKLLSRALRTHACFQSSFKTLVRKIHKFSDVEDRGNRTLSDLVDQIYRVKKFRNIYPIYTPRYLIAVANKHEQNRRLRTRLTTGEQLEKPPNIKR